MLRLEVDGQDFVGAGLPASGDYGWRRSIVPLTPGTHTVTWHFQPSAPTSFARLDRLELRNLQVPTVQLGICARITHLEGLVSDLTVMLLPRVAKLLGVNQNDATVTIAAASSGRRLAMGQSASLSLYDSYDVTLGAACGTSTSCASVSLQLGGFYGEPEGLMRQMRSATNQAMIRCVKAFRPSVLSGNPAPGLLGPAATPDDLTAAAASSDSWGQSVGSMSGILVACGVAALAALVGVCTLLRRLRRSDQDDDTARSYGYSQHFPAPKAWAET